tara:strand:- start:297 stop:848 length:552 start_codon:yes stop_codon:yes gene_type:complete
MSVIKDYDNFKNDGFLNGILDIDITAFDKVKWPPQDKENLDAAALNEISKIKNQLQTIFKTRYEKSYCNFYGVWKGYVEGVRGNVIVYLDKAEHNTDNYIDIVAVDRCKIFPEQGEYVWFNDSIIIQKRFNNDEVNNIRFIYFDYKLEKPTQKDFLEEAEKEKKELEESYQESVRQTKERQGK